MLAAGHARENQYAVLVELAHRFESQRRVTGSFENDVVGAKLRGTACKRALPDGMVSPADAFDQLRVRVGLLGGGERVDLEAAQTQGERREQSHRSGAEHGGSPRAPDPQTALNFVGLCDALFDDAARLEQDADLPKSRRDDREVLFVLEVVLRQVAVTQVDPALEIDAVQRKILCADRVVDAAAGAAYRRDDVVSGPHAYDVRSGGFDDAEALVARDEVIESRRGRAVLARKDLFVRTVDADGEHANQDGVRAGAFERRFFDLDEA